MKKDMTCKNCSTKFSGNSDADCPACAQYYASMLFAKRGIAEDETDPAPVEIKSLTKSAAKNAAPPKPYAGSASLDDLVKAQDRTTHAVRSLAEFVFSWLKYSLLGSVLLLAGIWISVNFIPSLFGNILVVIGGLVILVGFFVALNRGLDELQRSKP
jgi:hypothetical protein